MHTSVLPFEKKSTIPLDPRTKIFLTLTVSTIMVAGGVGGVMNIVRPCLFLLPVLLFLLSRKWSTAFVLSLVYAVLFGCEMFLFPHLSGIPGFIVGAFIGIYTHILPGFIMGYYMLCTTSVSEFVASMKRMHMPEKLIIPISVLFRFFPTCIEEYHAISDAMRMRGISSLRNPVKMLEYRIVPLMISVVKIGEELSAAALTRGLGGPEKRTNICTIGFGMLDAVLAFAAVCCWIGFFMS